MPIDAEKWERIRMFLEDASSGKDAAEIQRVFRDGLPEQKRNELRDRYNLTLDDMVEIHTYLEKVFHHSPLKFWWW